MAVAELEQSTAARQAILVENLIGTRIVRAPIYQPRKGGFDFQGMRFHIPGPPYIRIEARWKEVSVIIEGMSSNGGITLKDVTSVSAGRGTNGQMSVVFAGMFNGTEAQLEVWNSGLCLFRSVA